MSVHVEWGTAADAFPLLLIREPGEAADAYGTWNTLPALVVDTGSSLLLLEGNRDDLIAVGRRILELATAYRGPEELTEQAAAELQA